MIYGGLCNCGAWQSRLAPTPPPRDATALLDPPPRRHLQINTIITMLSTPINYHLAVYY